MNLNNSFVKLSMVVVGLLGLSYMSAYADDNISLKEMQPWGLWDVSEISFGTVNVNSQVSSDTCYLYLTEVELSDVAVTSTDERVKALVGSTTLTDDEGNAYYPVVFQLNSTSVTDSVKAQVAFTCTSDTLLIPVEGCVRNLNCSTIAQVKALAPTVSRNAPINFTGWATIQWRFRNQAIWVADNTGGIELEMDYSSSSLADELQPGARINFVASHSHVDTTNIGYYVPLSIQVDHSSEDSWAYPTRQLITDSLTRADYGKYVSLQNVTLDSVILRHPMFPRDDNKDPRWYVFKDENDNKYIVEIPVWSKYADDLPQSWQQGKLEVVGGVIASYIDYSREKPFILPQYIRPMEPESPLKTGTYTMTAKSYIYEENEEWDVTVDQDWENPYLYKFTRFVKYDGATYDAPIYGELDDDCDSLTILSGQQLVNHGSQGADVYLATAPSFDRSGNTPSQEPSPKGWPIDCMVDGDTITINPIIDYCCYVWDWQDPSDPFYSMRWSHYGIWYPGAKMVYGKSTNIEGVASTTDGLKEVARYSIDGKLLKQPVKGVNLVKMNDGSVRKVIIK
ncbi:MAG: hypothetical protein ACOYJG_03180 [Prevotella sp.]|jgi:hypothetical protein